MAVPWRTAVFWSVFRRVEVPVMQQPPERVRRASTMRNRLLALPVASVITGGLARGVEVEDTLATLADGTQLPIRVYRPAASGPGPLPVVVNFHGGGWVSGNIRQSEWWCSTVARDAGVAVVSVEYRLAPEHPFPIPAEDCYAATVWVAENAERLGVDAGRLAVMGDSAGGNLAAVTCLMSRDRSGPPIRLQVLIYPGTVFGRDLPSARENADAPILTRKDMDNAKNLYFHGSSGSPEDPYASPLRAQLSGLPPALVQTAQHDPIRDEGAEYARSLAEAGVAVRYTNYVDAVHGYITLPRLVPAARQAVAEVVTTIRDVLSDPAAHPAAHPGAAAGAFPPSAQAG